MLASLLVLIALLAPALTYFGVAASGGVVDVVRYLIVMTGNTAIVLWLIVLALPFLNHRPWPILRYRRWVGVSVFAYASLHLMTLVVLEWGLSVSLLTAAVSEKPFIFLGLLAWFTLLLMAITSNNLSVRKLRRRWKSLHRVGYIGLVAVLIHAYMAARSDAGLALLYIAMVLVLLVLRYGKLKGCLAAKG